MNGFLSEDIRLYWSLAPWDEDVVILILPWCRRLSPVATCRRLISAEYFGCTLIKHFIFVYVFKKNLKRWLVCFLTARLTHRKNHKLPGRVTFLVARETAGSILRDDNQFCVFSDANQRKHSLDYTISSSANCFLREGTSSHFTWVVAEAKCILVTAVCVSCLSVPRQIPKLLHGPWCNLWEW